MKALQKKIKFLLVFTVQIHNKNKQKTKKEIHLNLLFF
jgi:hypothetical protein